MSNNIPYDPCGHTKLACSDFQKSYKFYKDLFEQLEYKQIFSKDNSACWVSHDGYGILIAQAKILNYQYKHGAPGIYHICLKAKSKNKVGQIYQYLIKNSVFIFSPPKKHPEFTDRYYNLLFADPDGIKLEVAYY
jgi:predicted lactoylglutathione lyase